MYVCIMKLEIANRLGHYLLLPKKKSENRFFFNSPGARQITRLFVCPSVIDLSHTNILMTPIKTKQSEVKKTTASATSPQAIHRTRSMTKYIEDKTHTHTHSNTDAHKHRGKDVDSHLVC